MLKTGKGLLQPLEADRTYIRSEQVSLCQSLSLVTGLEPSCPPGPPSLLYSACYSLLVGVLCCFTILFLKEPLNLKVCDTSANLLGF